jgi:hypothetical protein
LTYTWSPTRLEERQVDKLSAVDLTNRDIRTTVKVRFNKHGVPHIINPPPTKKVVPVGPTGSTGSTGATGPAAG